MMKWLRCWTPGCEEQALPFSVWCPLHNDETDDERNARRERTERLMRRPA
jgi:hypothetical protein